MTEQSVQPSNLRVNLIRLGILIGVIAVSLTVFMLRDQVELLQRLGYPGILLVNLIGSASIVLPTPALAIVISMAALKTTAGLPVFNPFWVGVASAIGSTVGELTAYGAGFSGQTIVENAKWYDRIHKFTERYGILTIFILAILPLPLFDFAGIAAGTLRMPLSKFIIATLLGKLIKMWITAYGAAAGADWALFFLENRHSPH